MPKVQVAEQAGVGVDGFARPTEDRVVVLEHAVVVLDGATTLRPDLPSGGWYADRLSAELAKRLTDTPDGDLAALLATAIETVRVEHGLTPGKAPSSTVALLRWSDTAIDALVLADSPIAAFGGENSDWGIDVLADNRLAGMPRSGGGYRDRLRAGGGFDEQHLAALRAGAGATDTVRNTEGGFWVAEADPAAAYHAVRTSWRVSEVDTILMATDGLACAVDDYGLFNWRQLRTLVETDGPQAALDAVREAERADRDGLRWPRPKPHDDQALVLLSGW